MTNEYFSKHRKDFAKLTRSGQQLTINTLRAYVTELENYAMGFTPKATIQVGDGLSATVLDGLQVMIDVPGGSSVLFDVCEQRDLLPLLIAVDKERKFRNGEP